MTCQHQCYIYNNDDKNALEWGKAWHSDIFPPSFSVIFSTQLSLLSFLKQIKPTHEIIVFSACVYCLQRLRQLTVLHKIWYEQVSNYSPKRHSALPIRHRCENKKILWTDSCLVSQSILPLSWKPNAYYLDHQRPPLDTILSRFKPNQIITLIAITVRPILCVQNDSLNSAG